MVVYKFAMRAGRCTFNCDLPTARDNSSITSQCYFKDFRCNRYGRMMRNNPFNYRSVNSIGFSASVFGNGGGAIRGMTGGNFSILIEKVELI